MSFNTARIIGAINLFIAALLACLRYFISSMSAEISRLMLIVAIVCVAMWLIVTIIWCRCPHCHRVISQGAFLKSNCPYCKMPLDKKPEE